VDLDRLSKGSHKSISNTREALPVAKFALKANALGNLECRDDAPLDLLAGFPGSFAGSPVRPPGLIEVGKQIGLFRSQFLDKILHLHELFDEVTRFRLSCSITIKEDRI
jgi:hypothetical protein